VNKTLDSFESALLLELRQHVAEHPAPEPVRVRRPRRRLRLAAVGATGIAASVVAVFGLGSGGGSPAYAVDLDSDGDVIVTVHRLDDAEGLEKALAAKGIDADVSYDADGSTGQFSVSDPDGASDQVPQGQGGLTMPAEGDGPSHVKADGGQESGTGPSTSGPAAIEDECGPVDPPPATLAHDGGDWVLTIPAGSALHDRHVDIGTDASGALAVQYAGKTAGSSCGVMTMGSPGTP
jgi:hypothetical protein